jgi:hypothetical protein
MHLGATPKSSQNRHVTFLFSRRNRLKIVSKSSRDGFVTKSSQNESDAILLTNFKKDY